MKLFEDELKDIYWAEKALTTAIPKMIKNSTSPELVEALINHLADTEDQVARIETVFLLIEKRPSSKRCLAIEGLMKEVSEIMAACDPGAMCDAGIISAEQKVEHYEIASYETLRLFAEALGLEGAVELFDATLEEKRASVEKFAHVSVLAIQVQELTEEDDNEASELDHEQEYYLQLM